MRTSDITKNLPLTTVTDSNFEYNTKHIKHDIQYVEIDQSV